MAIGFSTAGRKRAGRLVAIFSVAVALAGLSGCVIAPYPGPGYYHHEHYWHDRDDYYRGYYR